MIFIPFWIFFRKQYVKKEAARDLLKRNRKFIPARLFMLVAVAVIIRFFVLVKLLNLYKEINQPIPFITQISSYVVLAVVLISFLVSIYLLSTPPNYERLDNILAKYKAGEMIKTSEVIGYKDDIILIVFLALIVGYFILSSILPIYNLTH